MPGHQAGRVSAGSEQHATLCTPLTYIQRESAREPRHNRVKFNLLLRDPAGIPFSCDRLSFENRHSAMRAISRTSLGETATLCRSVWNLSRAAASTSWGIRGAAQDGLVVAPPAPRSCRSYRGAAAAFATIMAASSAAGGERVVLVPSAIRCHTKDSPPACCGSLLGDHHSPTGDPDDPGAQPRPNGQAPVAQRPGGAGGASCLRQL